MSVAVAPAPAPAPANGHANGHDVPMDEATGPRFASGLILPPPEIKTVIDRTALFVARSANPPQFENKIRQNQVSDPKFSFLNPADPYHAYYRHRMARIEAGEEEEAAPAGAGQGKEAGDAQAQAAPQQTRGREPPAPEFMLDVPNISAMDLDTIRLTALFTARRGRTFLAALSAREGRNYQFEFLRPSHTLFGYFNRLVEQYTKVLLPPKETLDRLSRLATPDGKWKILEETREYAEWERIKREREKKRQDDKEAERKAFAEIDWHDYVVVQTIEFTAADATSDLPMPMTIQEMESMTVAQKRITNMITDSAAEDIDAYNARRAASSAPQASGADDDVQMEEGGDEAEEIRLRKRKEEEERARELERAKQIQATSLDASGSIKIRTDYVPKLGRKDKGPSHTTCQICGQQVPTDEIQEHMRIELLDPRWKEQRDMLEARKAQAAELQKGADVSATVKALARARVDIFGDEQDEVARQQEKAQQEAQAKEREKNVWDGHTASKLTTLEKYQSSVNFDEQIAAIHRAKGLTAEGSNIGPGIGPSSVPPPMLTTLPPPPPSLPVNPNFVGGAPPAPVPIAAVPPIPAIPVPPPAFGQPPPMMLPPLHYPPVPMMGGPPVPGAPPGMHPSRIAALAGGPPPQLAGQVRSADEMAGGDLPPAKRQRVAKLPEGQYYPEADWVNMHPHPISLRIQLPSHPEKPEWKMDGSVVTVPDLPVTLLLSTLRDRIIHQLGSAVAASKMRISYGGKMLTNANSIASYNLEDEDLLTLTVKDEKKKK